MLADELEGAGQGHPLPQRLKGGSLDGRAIGEGIAEGHSDFDNVGHLAGGPQRVRAGLCVG